MTSNQTWVIHMVSQWFTHYAIAVVLVSMKEKNLKGGYLLKKIYGNSDFIILCFTAE